VSTSKPPETCIYKACIPPVHVHLNKFNFLYPPSPQVNGVTQCRHQWGASHAGQV
jgi:hypothetical protein